MKLFLKTWKKKWEIWKIAKTETIRASNFVPDSSDRFDYTHDVGSAINFANDGRLNLS